MEITGHGLYRAEHRALRELYAGTRHMCAHWRKLAERIDGHAATMLARGAGTSEQLLDELATRTEELGLHGFPAAQGAGGRLAGLRNNTGDLLLERNQALRSAVLDVQHVTTLLGYLAALADGRSDTALAGWLRSWESRLRRIEDEVRAAAIAEGSAPERAVLAADGSRVGRAGHAIAVKVGTLGEAYDRRAARKS
jgi:hypothetical protein